MAKAETERTITIEEEKKAARKEAKEKRNAAKKLVKEFFVELKEQMDVPEDVLEAVTLITKAGSSRGEKKPSNAALIKELIIKEGHVSDVDLFMRFKVAQREMAGHIRNWIKKAEPEDRVWIMFDKEAEEYVHVGDGENPPENWEGYVPTTDEL